MPEWNYLERFVNNFSRLINVQGDLKNISASIASTVFMKILIENDVLLYNNKFYSGLGIQWKMIRLPKNELLQNIYQKFFCIYQWYKFVGYLIYLFNHHKVIRDFN